MCEPRCFQTAAAASPDFAEEEREREQDGLCICECARWSRLRQSVCVTQQHSLLLSYVDHYSPPSLKVTSQGPHWRTNRCGRVCRHTKSQGGTKGAAWRLILSRRRKTPLPLFLLSARLLEKVKVVILVPPEMTVHDIQYHAFYCWVSREHPEGNGTSYENALCYESAQTFECLTHTNATPSDHTHS